MAAAVAGALTTKHLVLIAAVLADFQVAVKLLLKAAVQQPKEARRRAWVSILGAS